MLLTWRPSRAAPWPPSTTPAGSFLGKGAEESPERFLSWVARGRPGLVDRFCRPPHTLFVRRPANRWRSVCTAARRLLGRTSPSQLLEHRLVQLGLGQELLQPHILGFQPFSVWLRSLYAAVLGQPAVPGRLGDLDCRQTSSSSAPPAKSLLPSASLRMIWSGVCLRRVAIGGSSFLQFGASDPHSVWTITGRSPHFDLDRPSTSALLVVKRRRGGWVGPSPFLRDPNTGTADRPRSTPFGQLRSLRHANLLFHFQSVVPNSNTENCTCH